LLTTTRSKRKPYVVKPLKAEVRAVKKDRPPLDLAPSTPFDGLLDAIGKAPDPDALAELVADFDMESLTDDQRNAARDLYKQRLAALTE
jgi:hypothetical protein